MDAKAALITEIAKLTSREQRLISSYHGREPDMQPEPDKLAGLIDTVLALEPPTSPTR